MINKGKYLAAALASLALAAGSAQASTTACWNPVEEAAAKVRNLQTRLMVATLQCQLVGTDITPAYNEFVRANRQALQGASAMLRTRLGERGYDTFVTLIANLSAGTSMDADQCTLAGELAGTGQGAGGEVRKLIALEEQLKAPIELPGGACPATFTLVAATAGVAGTAAAAPLPASD